MISQYSSYTSEFPPTDEILWNSPSGNGSYYNNADYINNEWGVLEHKAQCLLLSQPSQYGLSTDNDLQDYFRNSSSGVYLNWRVWVKLGTATFCYWNR